MSYNFTIYAPVYPGEFRFEYTGNRSIGSIQTELLIIFYQAKISYPITIEFMSSCSSSNENLIFGSKQLPYNMLLKDSPLLDDSILILNDHSKELCWPITTGDYKEWINTQTHYVIENDRIIKCNNSYLEYIDNNPIWVPQPIANNRQMMNEFRPIAARSMFTINMDIYEQILEQLGLTLEDNFEENNDLHEFLEKKVAISIHKDDLRKLPVILYQNIQTNHTECSICLDKYQKQSKIRQLPCQHIFHQECIDKWLTESRPTCPFCKQTAGRSVPIINKS